MCSTFIISHIIRQSSYIVQSLRAVASCLSDPVLARSLFREWEFYKRLGYTLIEHTVRTVITNFSQNCVFNPSPMLFHFLGLATALPHKL